ncbi:hypothetical protein [Sediminicurvatus halobius]|uniref:Uncharacterized protein n=1 Tax=Sediminicurvatus halobius TaxID=2182432 RepID=A0A2U2MY41_9GAMM|nr:hypothetical protein [Spiribacter halobius]PWG61728.1 hypothetical protein DEM34_14775 [Spiribacter halobius]UEX76844.1 hypothetical protein LMH63_12850 [Spiribacter halobius]
MIANAATCTDNDIDRDALKREEQQLFNELAVAKRSEEALAKLRRFRQIRRLLQETAPPPPPPEPKQQELFAEGTR